MNVPTGRGPLAIDGQVLDLAHLAMITRRVSMDLPGGLKKEVLVNFHFSSHCYSRSPIRQADGRLEEIPAARRVPDGSSHMPRPRIFCPDRYELSKHLVNCIDALIESNGIVTRTQQVNYFHLRNLHHAVPGLPNPADYYLFFGIKLVKPPNLPRQFKISVESAYVGANAHGRVARPFSATLGAQWAGQEK